MSKKKIALAVGSLALVGALAVGGTLAYFTAQTDSVTNVFTGENDDLGGKIVEDFDKEKAENYMPGDVITKVPTLENDASSIDAWVAVKVAIDVEGAEVSYDDFVKNYATISTNGVEGFNTDDYEEVTIDGANYKFFVFKNVVKKGESTTAIFDKVTVDAGIKTVYNKEVGKKTVYKEVVAGTEGAVEIDGKYYVEESTDSFTFDSSAKYVELKDGKVEATNIDKLPAFNIVVTGYMVQAQNVKYETAVDELKALVTAQQ